MILEPVKIGVIGSGGYAFELIKRIMSVPNFGLITAITAWGDGSPGERLCRDKGIPIFDSVDKMLDSGNLEVVLNPTPIHLHASLTKKCLAAGFPVWLEKPPVATVQELDDLLAVSDAAGLPVTVGFNSLYSHLTQNLKQDLVSGRFGKVHQIKGIGAWIRTSAYFHRNDWAGRLQKDGQWILDGDLNNPFAHVLCNNLYFASPVQHALAEPAKVEAELYRCNEIESEDTSCLRVRTRDGIEILNYLTLCPGQEIQPRTVIETERAVITFENFNKVIIDYHEGSVETHEAYKEDRIEMIEYLCRSLRTGGPRLNTLDMMRPFTVVVNAAFDSSGKVHPVPAEFLDFTNENEAKRTSISRIEEIMEDAFESNSLFSEIGVPWARKSESIDTMEYVHFPLRFKADG